MRSVKGKDRIAWTMRLAITLGATLLTPRVAPAEILYVDSHATEPVHDGASWCAAFLFLQDALAAAEQSAGSVTEIRVAGGIHRPDEGAAQVPGDRSATFNLIEGVSLIGSYAGCGSEDPDFRTDEFSSSILSGDLGRDDLPDFVNRDDNAYHVVFANDVDGTTLFRGFGVQDGHADGIVFPDADGAGMYVMLGGPTLRSIFFSDNSAEMHGGGLYVNDAEVRLEDCWFHRNRASGRGGGMFASGTSILTTPVFIANSAGESGGGLHISTASHATIDGGRFGGNSAGFYGGGIYTATGVGGGVELTRCAFSLNTARNGGALSLDGNAALAHNVIVFNNADEEGGGISISAFDDFDQRISSTTVVANSAGTAGGGIHVFSFFSAVAVDSSILWGNTVGGQHDQSAQLFGGLGDAIVDYSCVEGWTGALGGTGNIGLNPQFVDATFDPDVGDTDADFSLSAISPCIDAANPAIINGDGLLDFLERPRVMCGRADMGGYEFGFGDFNCDRVFNLQDFQGWQDCETGPKGGPYAAGCEAFDFNGDFDITIADFAGIQNLYEGP